MGDFQEAPASFNVRYRSPSGFDCQLTLRGLSGAELLPKTEAAIKWLQEHGASPNGRKPAGNPNAPTCPTHGTAMRQSQHGGWFCPQKIADDGGDGKPVYCRQKVKA